MYDAQCDRCTIHFPEEYAEACAVQGCRAQLCPVCDEDAGTCADHDSQAEPLPLAA